MSQKAVTGIEIVLAALILQFISVASPANGATPTSAKQMLTKLSVKPESNTSTYVRSKFKIWIDADSDSCDTREEVLIAEAVKKAKTGASCKVISGTWVSKYDGKTFTNASQLDIDHMIPLKEAWESGASKWDATTRMAFANDLGFAGSLIAVSASTNRSKGDKDPNRWMPIQKNFQCIYVANWVAVKYRWHLSVDSAEKSFLVAKLSKCGTSAKVAIPKLAKIH
jgi:hypothetical protein